MMMIFFFTILSNSYIFWPGNDTISASTCNLETQYFIQHMSYFNAAAIIIMIITGNPLW